MVQLVKFTSKRIPRKYSDDAVRRAVLYPLTGLLKVCLETTQKDIFKQMAKKTATLIWMWRNRLKQLARYNWYHLHNLSAYEVCLNCCPSVMEVDPITWNCKQAAICPFCYGRDLQELYQKTWTVCKGIDKIHKKDYWLIGYRHIQYMPVGNKSPPSLPVLFSSEKKERGCIYKDLSAFGGYVGTEFEPIGDYQWKLVRRGVLLVSAGVDLNNLDTAVKLKRVKVPSGQKVAQLIGWSMRYPSGLITHEQPQRVVQLLHARNGHRLHASYGLFRGAKR